MNKKIIIGSVIGVILIAIIAANVIRSSGSVSAFSGGRTFDVKVQKVEKGNISSTISASGVIEEVEKKEIYFETPMKVKKLYVKKNQKVSKGEKLVELELDALQSQLEQEKVNKSVQELAIQRALSGTAENNVKSAELAYNDAKKNFENSKALYESEAISKSDYERAEKAVKDAEIALNTARKMLGGQGIDTMTQQQSLKATELRIADIERKLKKIEENSLSPIDGVIAEINMEEGGFTSSMAPAFKLVNLEKLKIKADIKEYDIRRVAVGQDVKITGDAIDKKDEVMGKVNSISPVAKKSRTTSGEETLIEVSIDVVKSSTALKPGLSVTCDIITKVKNDVPIVSFEMLKEDKDGNKLVFVVDKDNIMRERKVELGITSDLSAEVVKGLEVGDNVVLNVQPSYKDGARAKIIKDEKK
ncbi:MAG: efflux RND transporter periplasmic adaptor subunit [Clostridia bacterium]|nr:efflux RND transporter periplasmic adaptor subunit [Clostridia bacterium]